MTKRIALFSWLFAGLFAQLSGGNLDFPAGRTDNSCDLPAPGNFHVVSSTTSSITLGWDPVTGAAAYYIVALDHFTQQVLDDNIVTTNIPILYVPAGSTVDVRVYSMCDNQEQSAQYDQIIGLNLIITELIVEAGAPCAEPYFAQPPFSSQSVYLQWQDGYTYWFDVVQLLTGNISRYEVILTSDSYSKLFTLRKVSEGYFSNSWTSVVTGSTDGSNFNAPPVAGFKSAKILLHTSRSDVPVYDLDYAFEPGQPDHISIIFNQVNEGYKVKFSQGSNCVYNEFQKSPIQVPTFKFFDSPTIRSPFTNTLRVAGLPSDAATVHFSLFDLNGRPVLDRNYPAASEYDLPTADLPPGFYMLRVENGAERRTYKVVRNP